MNLRSILIAAFLLCLSSAYAQQIEMIKTFGGVRFERDSITYSPSQVLDILSENETAYLEFKRAKTNYSFAGVLGFAGGFMIGFPLGTALFGGDPEWGLAAGGVALVLASIPLNNAFKSHAQNALDIYNSGQPSAKKPKLRFYFTGTGGSLVLKF
ncbi:MAG: hypothetical protein AB7O48_04260 [Cyclobacteriaceae bacterium]